MHFEGNPTSVRSETSCTSGKYKNLTTIMEGNENVASSLVGPEGMTMCNSCHKMPALALKFQ